MISRKTVALVSTYFDISCVKATCISLCIVENMTCVVICICMLFLMCDHALKKIFACAQQSKKQCKRSMISILLKSSISAVNEPA